MTEDQDKAGEVVAGAVRVALTVAGQIAEQAARRREADLRETERHSVARVATLQSQLAAERELALRSVRHVVQCGNAASVEEVVRAWEQARGWDDPTMRTEQARLEDRIRERFGIDAVARLDGVEVTAASLLARDAHLQADDVFNRGTPRDGVIALQDGLVNAEFDEAAAARALAAESYPTPAQWATRSQGVRSAARPRGARQQKSAEIESRGR